MEEQRLYPIRLTWKDIHVEGSTQGASQLPWRRGPQRVILEQVSGCASPGRLTVLMGSRQESQHSQVQRGGEDDAPQRAHPEEHPKAASTGRGPRRPSSEPQIVANGVAVPAGAMRKMSAFVPQDDLMLGALTVREHLLFTVVFPPAWRFQAHMRLGAEWTTQEKEKEVEELLTSLGLQRCASTLIGVALRKGISVGEKKRLAFACEVLFFLRRVSAAHEPDTHVLRRAHVGT